MKYCLKTEKYCLKTQTKRPILAMIVTFTHSHLSVITFLKNIYFQS